MAITIKHLADGQLAGSKGTIYTCPSGVTAIVRTIQLVNTDSSSRTVNLYVNSGTSRGIIPKDTTLKAGESLEVDLPVTLEAADLIEGDASSANLVDYTISGIERT